MSDTWRDVAAMLLGVFAVARCTRLVTSDNWPPVQWARDRWEAWSATAAPSWSDMFTCPFCFAPYAAAGDLALWWLLDAAHGSATDASNTGTWWWLMNLWAAASYAAAMVVVHDEPPPVD